MLKHWSLTYFRLLFIETLKHSLNLKRQICGVNPTSQRPQKYSMRWQIFCFFNFRANSRGALPEVNLLTHLTAGQKFAVTPIPERLAALESWNLAENFDTKHDRRVEVFQEELCSERVLVLGKEVDMAGRSLFFIFARFTSFLWVFTKENDLSNISLWISYFGLLLRTESIWISTPGKKNYQAQEHKFVSLIFGFYVFLRANLTVI